MNNGTNLIGNGTELEPYLISSQTDLETFAKDVNDGNSYEGKFIKLTNDIICNYNRYNQWTPIANDFDKSFQGTFNGNGKTISGLYFDNSDKDLVGLFGKNKGIIKNVCVVYSYFKGNVVVGSVCGYNNKNGIITNCYNTGKVSGSKNIGGMCGENAGTITNCYNTGKVSGSEYIGDVCGWNNIGTITNCYYLSDVDNGKGAKTKEQFNNGYVAYLLSQGNNGGVWGQDLSNPISLPTLYGSKVYYDKTNNKYVNSDNNKNDAKTKYLYNLPNNFGKIAKTLKEFAIGYFKGISSLNYLLEYQKELLIKYGLNSDFQNFIKNNNSYFLLVIHSSRFTIRFRLNNEKAEIVYLENTKKTWFFDKILKNDKF